MAEQAAGLVVRLGERLRFVPATAVREVTARPILSPVPGSYLAMALIGGRILPVVQIGDDCEPVVVCRVGPEEVGLCGLAVAASGSFEPAGAGVRFGDQRVEPLDVAGELARARDRATPPLTGDALRDQDRQRLEQPGAGSRARQALERARHAAINAGLQAARLGGPAGKPLGSFADELRTLLSQALDALDAELPGSEPPEGPEP